MAQTFPIIANLRPIKVELEAGKNYFWCQCGLSQSQPFCDGSHAGTNFRPKVFKAEKDGDAWLCMCKYTGNAPYCDGTHKKFTTEQVGQKGPDALGS